MNGLTAQDVVRLAGFVGRLNAMCADLEPGFQLVGYRCGTCTITVERNGDGPWLVTNLEVPYA